ncbi:MAG: hypothetical protein UW46_C0004G0052 [Candidatus Yanofskybacteria bacterium GW2011_GWF1_44_227]|nr:MAG: hypothetical protein UW46_C0004G0052 [Candidatus Yanofskybacteria bacterium GW2011_GWF1_44_227]
MTSGLAEGKIEQTPEETAATMQELSSCGLPATDVEAVATMKAAETESSGPGLPDLVLAISADALVKTVEPKHRAETVAEAVRLGIFSVKDGEKILALAAKIE